MKPREPEPTGQRDMFRSRLDRILDMGHPKVVLAEKIDWRFLSERLGEVYTDRKSSNRCPIRVLHGRRAQGCRSPRSSARASMSRRL